MSQALVTSIITVFNNADYLSEAIESVLDQTHQPMELIVVNDGSDDGSGDIARRYGSKVRCVDQPRAGIGAARNLALGLATGDYLSILGADDRFARDKTEKQLQALRDDPELQVVFGHVREFVSPRLDDLARSAIREPRENAPGRLPATMLIRRAAFDRIGQFSTDVRVGVCLEWCTRLSEAGMKSLLLPDVVLERRLHAGNNGLREAPSRNDYARVLKAALDRRRSTLSTNG